MNSSPIIAIIGAGAAGLMAAATIYEKNPRAHVVLIEKNASIGQKILMTGGGRCNVTTALDNPRDVLTHYPRGARFLSYAMYEFSPAKLCEWFEAHDVPLKTEELRVFPRSERAQDVVDVFEKILEAHSGTIRVLLNYSVQKIEKTTKGFRIEFDGANDANENFLMADRVLIATGGKSRTSTAPTCNSLPGEEPAIYAANSGYFLAAPLGHTITPLAPSLQALCLAESWIQGLAGVSFKKVKFTLDAISMHSASASCVVPGHTFTAIGSFVFTHDGVSGPAVFALSAQAAYEKFSSENPAPLFLDFFPDESPEALTARLKTALSAHPHQILKNTLPLLDLPRSFVEGVLQSLEISDEKRGDQVSKKEIALLVEFFKKMPFHVIGRKTGQEMVTAGGVNTDEVDPKTMASKICPGLFLAGEVLNLDGVTGGFNLQAAWCTGRLAGENIIV